MSKTTTTTRNRINPAELTVAEARLLSCPVRNAAPCGADGCAAWRWNGEPGGTGHCGLCAPS